MKSRRFRLAAASFAVVALATVLLVRQRVAAAQRRHGPLLVASATTPSGTAARGDSGTASPSPTAARLPTIDTAVESFDPSHARREQGHYVVDLPRDRRAVLTLEPNWQHAITELLNTYELPRASVVVIDTDSGRVLAYASRAEAGAGDIARDASAPTASVYKIVTASALVQHGITEDTVTCFSGGFHAIVERDLVPDPHRDRDCISLAEAFGRSANTVFARRALERLTPAELLAAAHAWGFGEAAPFDAAVTPGPVDVPDGGIEFARSAAGFWHSYLSPVHAVILAQAIARGGEMQRPYIIDGIFDARGIQLAAGGPHVWRRAVPPEVATSLAHMMVHSVSEGTAYHAFHDAGRHEYLPGVDVSGKTGTLTGGTPSRAYTWFVGNAVSPSRHVSFAVMVANGPVWRVRAPVLARQVLQIVYRGRATD